MGSHTWREIAFGMPSPRLLPEGCNCTEDCHVKVSQLVGEGTINPMVLGLFLSFPTLFLHLRTAAPLWGGVLLCFVSFRVDLPTVWHGWGR